MIEEGFLFRSIVWDIAVTSLRVIRVARVIPAYRWTGVGIRCGVRAWSLNPTLWHIMVAEFCEDGIISNTRVLWITVRTLHRRHSRRCAELLVILLTLLFYLHHAGDMQYPVDNRNNGALLGLIETCIWLYMSQSNSLLLLLTEDYLEPCRSMLCPV